MNANIAKLDIEAYDATKPKGVAPAKAIPHLVAVPDVTALVASIYALRGGRWKDFENYAAGRFITKRTKEIFRELPKLPKVIKAVPQNSPAHQVVCAHMSAWRGHTNPLRLLERKGMRGLTIGALCFGREVSLQLADISLRQQCIGIVASKDACADLADQMASFENAGMWYVDVPAVASEHIERFGGSVQFSFEVNPEGNQANWPSHIDWIPSINVRNGVHMCAVAPVAPEKNFSAMWHCRNRNPFTAGLDCENADPNLTLGSPVHFYLQ